VSTRSAIVLLSGGLDSATAAAEVSAQGYDLYALTIDYNQRHQIELEAAHKVAKVLKVIDHKILKLDLSAFGGSALTDDTVAIPKDQDPKRIGVPTTYVPARNTIMLALALAWAEVTSSDAIVIGANAIDYSGYPDCRPDFLHCFEGLARIASAKGIEQEWEPKILSPLLKMSKAEIIHLAHKHHLDLALTWSCYDPSATGHHCGRCDSCLLRKKGFEDAGIDDPTHYVDT